MVLNFEIRDWTFRYGVREALAIMAEEGLEKCWARHEKLHKDLWKGLTAMGLEPFVENPDDRLVTVNTIKAYISSIAAK